MLKHCLDWTPSEGNSSWLTRKGQGQGQRVIILITIKVFKIVRCLLILLFYLWKSFAKYEETFFNRKIMFVENFFFFQNLFPFWDNEMNWIRNESFLEKIIGCRKKLHVNFGNSWLIFLQIIFWFSLCPLEMRYQRQTPRLYNYYWRCWIETVHSPLSSISIWTYTSRTMSSQPVSHPCTSLPLC